MVLLESPTIKTYVQHGNKDVQLAEKDYNLLENRLDFFVGWNTVNEQGQLVVDAPPPSLGKYTV